MRIIVLLFIALSFNLSSQDAYHTSLLADLKDNYGLEDEVFLLPNTEQQVFSQTFLYGNQTSEDILYTDQTFSISKSISIPTAGNNAWDVGMGTGSISTVTTDDLILVTFWAKQTSSNSQVFVYAEDGIDFEKEFYFSTSFTPDWTQYFVAFQSVKNYNVDRLRFGFHLASQAQDVEIAGLAVFNYEDKYEISDLPSSFSPFNYEGSELDAPWRELADIRIESIRKADLNINVIDMEGNAVEGASVHVGMQQHDFGFGSALVTCRFPGNNCFDQTYVDKVLDLDGEGHGFNECVNENALKWRAWEQEWLGTPEETVAAFTWLNDQGITMRGHNLLWPGSSYLPNDINDNLNDIDYLRNRIDGRIEEMITHPELSSVVRDWDILNEITTNRTLENAFDSDPTLENGRKFYNEIYNKVRVLDPTLELYINDYMAISSGSANLVSRYKMFLDELLADNVPFDGIGFQAHIGSVPNSIPQVEQIFNEFYQRYGKRMKITEFDMNPIIDESIQGDYMRDFLTLTFSHPGMDAFIMWGFWDGNHWKNNAPMFYENWTLKPSGEAFIQKVFNDWWTDETILSDTNGVANFRPFKGKHRITITKGNVSSEIEIELINDETIEVVLDGFSNISDFENNQFVLISNPSIDGTYGIEYPTKYNDVTIEVYDINSKLVSTHSSVNSGRLIQNDMPSGLYLLKIKYSDKEVLRRLIVQD